MSYAKIREPSLFEVPSTFAAWDEFEAHATSGLTGKVSPSSGGDVWTVAPPAGAVSADPDDFQVQWGDSKNTYKNVIRSSAGDSAPRIVTLGTTNYPTLAWRGTVYPGAAAYGLFGAALRVQDMGNYAFFVVDLGAKYFRFARAIGGAAPIDIWAGGSAINTTTYDWQVVVLADGMWQVWMVPTGSGFGKPLAQGVSAQLGSGGPLATGRVGLFDYVIQTPCPPRLYDHVNVAIPSARAVLYPSRQLRLTHEKATRQDAGGLYEGDVPSFEGRHVKFPPATRAGKRSRLVFKLRRRDNDSGMPDEGLGDFQTITVKVFGRVTALGGPLPLGFPTYTLFNVLTDRQYNANLTSLNELADVLGTLIGDYPLPIGAYSITNAIVPSRTLNARACSEDQLADVLATVINDLNTAGPAPAYSLSNDTVNRTLNADAVSINSYADLLATFIRDLITAGDL